MKKTLLIKVRNIIYLAYDNGFKYRFQSRLYKMIFEGIFNEKLQDKINKEVQERVKVSKTEDQYKVQVEKIEDEITFEYFKVRFFEIRNYVLTHGNLKTLF